MKYLIYCVIIMLGIQSCFQEKKLEINKRKYVVFASHDNFWTSNKTYCDSATMISKSEVILYIDGHKTRIFAGQFYIQLNEL